MDVLFFKQFCFSLNNFDSDAEANLTALGAEFGSLSQEEMVRLRIKGGVKIKSLTQGKLRSAGIQPGFIITKVDETLVGDTESLRAALAGKAKGEGIMIEGVYPNGTRAYYGFGL